MLRSCGGCPYFPVVVEVLGMFSTVGWRGPVGGHGECSVMALSAPVLVLYINRVRKRRKWIHGTKIACVFVSSWCAISGGLHRLRRRVAGGVDNNWYRSCKIRDLVRRDGVIEGPRSLAAAGRHEGERRRLGQQVSKAFIVPKPFTDAPFANSRRSPFANKTP